jgi:hypothetical protein
MRVRIRESKLQEERETCQVVELKKVSFAIDIITSNK